MFVQDQNPKSQQGCKGFAKDRGQPKDYQGPVPFITIVGMAFVKRSWRPKNVLVKNGVGAKKWKIRASSFAAAAKKAAGHSFYKCFCR